MLQFGVRFRAIPTGLLDSLHLYGVRGQSAAATPLLRLSGVALSHTPNGSVEQALTNILRRHSIPIMTRDEAMMPLTAIQLPHPTESNVTADTDHVFFALFNNEY